MKRSFVFLANGFEETEAISVIDVLRRAGLPVTTVSISKSHKVIGAHDIAVEADSLFDETDFSDALWLILPGGMPGATNLANHAKLTSLLKAHNEANGKIAAICASPAVVLAPIGILDGKTAVCYPGFEQNMTNVKLGYEPIVACENVITANGPAAAMQFGLAIVTHTLGNDQSRAIAEGLLIYMMHHEQEQYF